MALTEAPRPTESSTPKKADTLSSKKPIGQNQQERPHSHRDAPITPYSKFIIGPDSPPPPSEPE